MKIPTWAPVELLFILVVAAGVGGFILLMDTTMPKDARFEFEQWCTRAGGEALDIRDRTVCVDRKVILGKDVT